MSPTDQVRTVELRLRAAVESSPSGLLMVDTEGNIVLVNREVERLFGYSREEILGKAVEMLVPTRFRAPHPGFRAGFFQNPRVRAMGVGRELYGLRRDGTEFAVEIGLTPVATEEGLFVISSIVDISARKEAEEHRAQLEEQLRQSQKLEALGTLAGGVAHDFNNVLGSVIGYTELARDAASHAGIQAVVADLEEVLRAATRGRELIDRILRFSRRQELERRPTDLGQVVSETARLLRSTLPAGIDMQLDVRQSLPRVLADSTSVQQVMMNLANNSAHAMPRGGTLRIALEPLYVRDSVARSNPHLREGPYVVLSVSDTGEGMDEATRARAFEPFFTTKPPGSGSGLGLAMVHGIVQDHRGDVRLESEPGQGTVVECLFPSVTTVETERELALGAVPRGRGQRVLYVDDEPALGEVGRRHLVALKYNVTVASDPLTAHALLASEPTAYDLVITDYSMPRMTGVELASELHRISPDLPIILLSGFLEDFPDDKLAEAGIRRLVKKPVTARDLGEFVHAVLYNE